MEIERFSVLRYLTVTTDLMQVLAVSLRVSQHVGEQNNDTAE